MDSYLDESIFMTASQSVLKQKTENQTVEIIESEFQKPTKKRLYKKSTQKQEKKQETPIMIN
jgi:hypothetical protein